MKISDNLKKPYWVRKVINGRAKTSCSIHTAGYYTNPVDYDPATMQLLTEDDFMREIEAGSHDINSDIYSKRPIFDVEKYTDKNGKEKKKWKLKGFDDAEVVALSLQRRFAIAKASYMAADGFGISNETTDHDAFSSLMSWKDTAGLDTAFLEVLISCTHTGDGAIYVYQNGNTLEYKVFSHLYGDRLFPQLDEDRKPVLYRQYTLNGKNAVDVYSTKRIQTWVQIDPKEDADKSWVNKVKGWFGKLFNLDGAVSEDGYKCIYDNETQVSTSYNQCTYFRFSDIPSGCVEGAICSLERALSYIAEEVKSSAFPALFLKAMKFESLPPMSKHGRTFGVQGNADDVKVADAKYLTKQDMSNIANVHIKSLSDNIMHGSLSVFIDPEILKQGSDSSTTIKIMFAPEIQWCKTMWPQVFHQVRALAEVFKELVGKIEGDVNRYGKMRISVWQKIWIPQNDTETINNEIAQANARVKSRKAVMDDLSNTHIDDEKHIWEEWQRELEIKARIPAEEKAKVDKEYGATSTEEIVVEEENEKPKIDKRMAGQSVYRDN